jgi:apoptosis-inducing factor 2
MIGKNVLTIGVWAAGHQVAYKLRDFANVILVDPRTYCEVPMGVPRRWSGGAI